jgi:hypothetical protein
MFYSKVPNHLNRLTPLDTVYYVRESNVCDVWLLTLVIGSPVGVLMAYCTRGEPSSRNNPPITSTDIHRDTRDRWVRDRYDTDSLQDTCTPI